MSVPLLTLANDAPMFVKLFVRFGGEDAVEVTGEVALDAAPDLLVGLSFGAAALDVGDGRRMAACAAASSGDCASLDTEFRTHREVATGSRLAASGFLRCGTAEHYDRLAARARLAAREPGHLTSSAISGSGAVRQEMRGGSGRLTPGAGSRRGGG